MEKKIKCSECGKKMDKIDVFPQGLCMDCHGKKFDAQERKKTPEQVLAEFKEAWGGGGILCPSLMKKDNKKKLKK